MTEMTYLFGDILTGDIIDEIPLRGVSMTRTFGAGIFRASFHLDQTGKNNTTLLEAAKQGRNFIVVERNGIPIWGGFIWVATYQSQAKNDQLIAKAWEHYPDSRIIRADFLNANLEQRNIFINLWNSMTADPNSIKFEIPEANFATEVQKTIDVKDYEYKSYRTVIDNLANTTDGFDWTVDTVKGMDGKYERQLKLGFPWYGELDPNKGPQFDYAGQILNYWENNTMGESGTHFYGLGTGQGSSILNSTVTHQDLLDDGFPRFDRKVSFKDVDRQDILDVLTSRFATVNKPNRSPIFTVQLRADEVPEFNTYGLGDNATLWIVDPAHTTAEKQKNVARIIGWEYYPPRSDRSEEVRLVFEGGDFEL